VLDVEMDRRDRVRGGNKDECHPFTQLEPLALLSGHPRLELVEMSVHDFRHAGIFFHHEQGEPGIRVVQIAYDIARSLQGTSRRTPLRNQQGLRRRIGDH